MNVKQLIEELKKMNPNAIVWINVRNADYVTNEIEITNLDNYTLKEDIYLNEK